MPYARDYLSLCDESIVSFIEKDLCPPSVRRLTDGLATVDLDADVGLITGLTTQLRIFAGHAGWSAGQLDDELVQGAWFVVPGSAADVFSDEPRTLWSRVLRRQPPPLSLVATYPPDPALN